MAALFSRKKPSEELASDIPPEFFDAVTIMGDPKRDTARGRNASLEIRPMDTASTTSPFSQEPGGNSPFLAEHEQEQVGKVLEQQAQQAAYDSLKEEMIAETRKDGLAPVNPVEELYIEPKNKGKRFLIIGIGFLCLALLGGAGAYYFLMRKTTDTENTQKTPEIPEKKQEPKAEEKPVPPFSLDKPNYLLIDVETATAADIRKIFSERFARIMENGIQQPVEFIVTDQNNNPVALSRLAYIANLEIQPELLNLIGEGFSIYVVNDAGQMRLGLALTIKDPAFSQMIMKEEAVLPYAFKMLFYDPETITPRRAVFREGNYNAQTVRFTNIDAAKNLSFDYALRGNEWFIGSSKNALRAVIDKNPQ